jgi:transcriptional regulator with XRE-family HTH domain
MPAGTSQTSEFGTFLRSRRERRRPAEVGLPEGSRRRTPGLRREELATLAGISVDYLVRLEQGRELHPSGSVLSALSDALGLSDAERKHFFTLSMSGAQPELCPSAPVRSPLGPRTHALLERLDPTPAFVLEANTDVIAWNRSYDRFIRPTGLLDADRPNLLRYTFLEPYARSFYRDWQAIAREQVSNLRAATGEQPDDGSVAAIVGELSVKSPEFARLWARYDVGGKCPGGKQFRHPVVGELDLELEVLILTDPVLRRLVSYFPADEASERALSRAVADPDAIEGRDGREGQAERLRLVDEIA